MKVFNKTKNYLLIILICILYNIDAQITNVCDTSSTFSVPTVSNAYTTSGYELIYVLVGSDGSTVIQTSLTGTFNTPSAGNYTCYAVNHDGNAVFSAWPPTGTSCLDTIARNIIIGSGGCELTVCNNSSFTSTVSNANILSGYNLTYLIANGSTVVASSSTGTFDINALGLAAGSYTYYAVNDDGTGDLSSIPITGACVETISKSLTIENCTPLPLKLIKFDGESIEEYNHLRWVTEDEENFSHFILQKSIDGRSFYDIKKVEGKNDKQSNIYEHKDFELSSLAYYRLKMVDSDQSVSFSSNIVIRRRNNNSFDFNLYPNPFEEVVSISPNQLITGNSHLKIINELGQVIYSANDLDLSTNYDLDLSEMNAGTYIITIISDRGKYYISKLIKN